MEEEVMVAIIKVEVKKGMMEAVRAMAGWWWWY